MSSVTAKRTLRLYVRVTEQELKDIKNKAELAGMSVSEFARQQLSNGQVVAAPSVGFIETIRELKRIGSNLNQIARKLNALEILPGPELKQGVDDIEKIMDLLYRDYHPGKE